LRCKLEDQNFGSITIASYKWALGVWEEEKRVDKSPPIADAFAAWDHT